MRLADRFAELDENLKLDPLERKRAEETHNYIGELLVSAGLAKRTRLQGSFARKTMLPPLHDIDKVIELADDLRSILSTAEGPRKVMQMIRATVLEGIPTAQFEVKKHALGIILPDDGFDFDAVPAFNPEDGSGWIRIANTKADVGEEAWKPSNTYLLIEAIAKLNQRCGGRFVRQVRMAKQIIFTAGISEELPGLHVETFAYLAISERIDHPSAVAAVLSKACELVGGPYSDPTGVDQISDRLEPHHIARICSVLPNLSARAQEALALSEDGDETRASHIWADLFGTVFPRPTDAEEKAFLRSLYSPLALAPTAPPVRAWKP